jgi:hypothetical protein
LTGTGSVAWAGHGLPGAVGQKAIGGGSDATGISLRFGVTAAGS